jgi:hypothetical protein
MTRPSARDYAAHCPNCRALVVLRRPGAVLYWAATCPGCGAHLSLTCQIPLRATDRTGGLEPTVLPGYEDLLKDRTG